ncbi:MAG: hypothetical protein ACT4OZ_01450 [Gemmatimonadota bacterium]
MSEGNGERDVIVDMEAGLEHLSRGTGRHLTRFVAVMEPYYRSMETAKRVAQLAAELGIDDVVAVANKVRDDADRAALGEFCARNSIILVGEIPYDQSLAAVERSGLAPVEQEPAGPAVMAIERLVDAIA